jgi:hypothetical protein
LVAQRLVLLLALASPLSASLKVPALEALLQQQPARRSPQAFHQEAAAAVCLQA